MWLPRVILLKALVLQDECFGKNYSSFLYFIVTTSGREEFFVLWADNTRLNLRWCDNYRTLVTRPTTTYFKKWNSAPELVWTSDPHRQGFLASLSLLVLLMVCISNIRSWYSSLYSDTVSFRVAMWLPERKSVEILAKPICPVHL